MLSRRAFLGSAVAAAVAPSLPAPRRVDLYRVDLYRHLAYMRAAQDAYNRAISAQVEALAFREGGHTFYRFRFPEGVVRLRA